MGGGGGGGEWRLSIGPLVSMVTPVAVVSLPVQQGAYQEVLRGNGDGDGKSMGYDASEVEDGEMRQLIAMQA